MVETIKLFASRHSFQHLHKRIKMHPVTAWTERKEKDNSTYATERHVRLKKLDFYPDFVERKLHCNFAFYSQPVL